MEWNGMESYRIIQYTFESKPIKYIMYTLKNKLIKYIMIKKQT